MTTGICHSPGIPGGSMENASMSTRQNWEFQAIRNKAGVFTCELTDPHGGWVIESLHDCAASSEFRTSVNSPDEIAHIKEFSEFLKVRARL